MPYFISLIFLYFCVISATAQPHFIIKGVNGKADSLMIEEIRKINTSTQDSYMPTMPNYSVQVYNKQNHTIRSAKVFFLKRSFASTTEYLDTLPAFFDAKKKVFYFDFADSLKTSIAVLGGFLYIEAPNYTPQKIQVSQYWQPSFQKTVYLGKKEDIFLRQHTGYVYPLNYYREFLEFREKNSLQKTSAKIKNRLTYFINKYQIDTTIQHPMIPLASYGFDNKYERVEGILLPKDSILRKELLDEIEKDSIIKTYRLHYLWNNETSFYIGSWLTTIYFPIEVQDSFIQTILNENGFEQKSEILIYNISPIKYKYVNIKYKNRLDIQILQSFSNLILKGKALYYNTYTYD